MSTTRTRVVCKVQPSPPTGKSGHHPLTQAQQKPALLCHSGRVFLQRCTLCGDFNAQKKVRGQEQLEGHQPEPLTRPPPGGSSRPCARKQVTTIPQHLIARTVKVFQRRTGMSGKGRGGRFGSCYQPITLMPSQKPLYDLTLWNCHSYPCLRLIGKR